MVPKRPTDVDVDVRDELIARVQNAIYDARNAGEPIGVAAINAVDQVLAYVAELPKADPPPYRSTLEELRADALQRVENLWGPGMVKITPEFAPEDVVKIMLPEMFEPLARALEIAQLQTVVIERQAYRRGLAAASTKEKTDD